MYTIFTIFYQFVNKILTAAHTNANIFLEVGNMGFNENLRLLLIQKEMKQADLCRMTGIQTSLMSEYISGKKSPTIRNAILIADAFDISLDTLAGREERVRYSRRADHAYGIQLNESMDGLSEKECTFVLDVIKAMRQHLK